MLEEDGWWITIIIIVERDAVADGSGERVDEWRCERERNVAPHEQREGRDEASITENRLPPPPPGRQCCRLRHAKLSTRSYLVVGIVRRRPALTRPRAPGTITRRSTAGAISVASLTMAHKRTITHRSTTGVWYAPIQGETSENAHTRLSQSGGHGAPIKIYVGNLK